MDGNPLKTSTSAVRRPESETKIRRELHYLGSGEGRQGSGSRLMNMMRRLVPELAPMV